MVSCELRLHKKRLFGQIVLKSRGVKMGRNTFHNPRLLQHGLGPFQRWDNHSFFHKMMKNTGLESLW